MSSSRPCCGKCGSPLPHKAPEGFCPRCAFTGALGCTPDQNRIGPLDTTGVLAGVSPGSAVHCFGDYELVQEIGRGGMGVVYRAKQISLNRVVAVKMLLHGRFSEEVFVKRFHVEAETAAHLDHPNIVPIYEVGQHEGQHYFSMKLIEGESLAQQLAKGKWETAQGPESLERRGRNQQIAIAGMVAKLARAVHYAHQHGVLHRDLKPHNILVDAQGQPHLTDFGLAKLMQQETGLTISQAVMGSPAYMSPEQASGKIRDLSTATDIYGLGAILYTLLTGRAPFEAETALATMQQVVEQQPARPRALRPHLSRDLETICLKCLAKVPSRRYASAEALAEDLDHWLENKPISIRPVSGIERLHFWCRRKPVVASLAATSLLIFALGLAGVLWQWQRAEEQSMQREQALVRSQKERYAASIAVVQNLMNQGQFRQAREQLDDPVLLPHRGWEWGWLESKCHQDVMTISPRSMAPALTYLPDGKRLVNGGSDGFIRIWSVEDGTLLKEWKAHDGMAWISPRSVAPDGTRVVSFGWEKPYRTRISDITTGEELQGWTNSAMMRWCEFSPDGRYVATGGEDRRVSVRDSVTGKLVTEVGYGDNVFSLSFSPDGEKIAFGGGAYWLWQGRHDTTVRLWEWKTGRQQVLDGHDRTVACLAFSPDGRTLASSSVGSVRLWDVATGTNRLTLDPTGGMDPLFSIAFHPCDDRLLAVAGSKRVEAFAQLLDPVTGHALQDLRGHSQGIRQMVFSPDGSRLATAGIEGKVKIWQTKQASDYLSLEGHSRAVWAVACSLDGRSVATGSLDGTVRLWALETGQPLGVLDVGLPVVSLTLSSDGKTLVTPTPGNSAAVLDVTAGRPLWTLDGHTRAIVAVALSRDEKWICTGSKDKTAILWNARDRRLTHRLHSHKDWVLSAAFDKGSKRVVTGGADNRAVVWDIASGQRLLTITNSGQVQSVAFSADGLQVATGSKDKYLRVYDAYSGRVLWSAKAHDDGLTSVSFSPDGQRLATAAGTSVMQSGLERDWSVAIWDLRTGYRLFRFEAHGNSVLSVAFSPDGRRLVTGGGDNTARVYEAFPWRAQDYPGNPADPLEERVERYKRARGQAVARRLNLVLPAIPARTNLLTIIGQVNVPCTVIPKISPRLPIAAREERCTKEQIDLSRQYNAALHETWVPITESSQVDMNLAALTPGLRTVGPIQFDVRGVIQLRRAAMLWDWDWSKFPEQVSIPVGTRCGRFHVLHGAMYAQGLGSQVGTYWLHYSDGTEQSFPIQIGRDVEDWSWPSSSPEAITPAWQTEDPSNPGRFLRLYAQTYVNPHPEREVSSLEFISTLSDAGPFLVALTIE